MSNTSPAPDIGEFTVQGAGAGNERVSPCQGATHRVGTQSQRGLCRGRRPPSWRRRGRGSSLEPPEAAPPARALISAGGQRAGFSPPEPQGEQREVFRPPRGPAHTPATARPGCGPALLRPRGHGQGGAPLPLPKGWLPACPPGAREAPRASREHLSAPAEAPSSGLTRTSRSVTLSSAHSLAASGDAACGRPAAPVSTASRGRRPNRSAGVALGALQSPKSLTLLSPDPRAPAVCHTEDHWSSGHLSRPSRSVKTQPGQEPALSEV